MSKIEISSNYTHVQARIKLFSEFDSKLEEYVDLLYNDNVGGAIEISEHVAALRWPCGPPVCNGGVT
jgi:hypothetical protein